MFVMIRLKGCEWAVLAAKWREGCTHHRDRRSDSWEQDWDSAAKKCRNQVNSWPLILILSSYDKETEILIRFLPLQCSRSTFSSAKGLRGIEAQTEHNRNWQQKPVPEDDHRDRWPQQNQDHPRRASHWAYPVCLTSITAVSRVEVASATHCYVAALW